MSNREVRISPDGDMVAVRSDWPDDAWNAWGVMHAVNGGHWCKSVDVRNWLVAVPGEPADDGEPEPQFTSPPFSPPLLPNNSGPVEVVDDE